MDILIQKANPYGPFDEAAYEELRSALGITLPEDYLDYLRRFNGGTPVHRDFVVVPGDWTSGIDELFGMQRQEPALSLLSNLNWVGLELKPGLLAIGVDGCFGYILISTNQADHGAIYFCATWSDDGVTDFYKNQGYWRIADSFSDFLKKLHSEQAA